jgi:hypothetical protein
LSWAHQKTYTICGGIYLLDVYEDEHPDDDCVDSEAEISLQALSGTSMRLSISMED